jgi:hypothetical protein
VTHHPDVQKVIEVVEADMKKRDNPLAESAFDQAVARETERLAEKYNVKIPAATPTEPDDYEKINRPQHYRISVGDGHPFDVIELIEALSLGFELGNALKYLVRAGRKPGVSEVEDLRKAAYYLTRRADQIQSDDELS